MNIFGKAWKLVGSRMIGGAVSMAAGYVFVKTKGIVQLDPQQLVEVGGTMLSSYAIAHRLVSNKINPGDAANARLATAEKESVKTGEVVQPAPPVSSGGD